LHARALAPDAGQLVREALDTDPGQPLPPATRTFLEGRFGRDFRPVRIHNGPASAAAARRLNARAFTLGRHIVFAPGQYEPATARGLKLLGHELAHVVQQGATGDLPGPPWRVGRLHDGAEYEAEQVARRLITSAPLPALSADPGGVLRRAVQVNAASAGIDLVVGQVVPDVFPNGGPAADMVAFHLTRGFNSANPSGSSRAMDFFGHVGVALGPGDSLAGWSFGFLQFVRINFLGIFYAGRRRREGSISVRPFFTDRCAK
jgi:hypothetical protein